MGRLKKFFKAGALEAGCDEAGRGCLAGPVVASAVILSPEKRLITNLNDSKQVAPEQRKKIARKIKDEALAYAIIAIDNKEIDRINILQASVKAMNKAVSQLCLRPDLILVDGHYFHTLSGIDFQCIIDGDAKYASISAASILAKVYRDEIMERYHDEFPIYDWFNNKGYATPKHREGLEKFGPCYLHRRSFKLTETERQLEIF